MPLVPTDTPLSVAPVALAVVHARVDDAPGKIDDGDAVNEVMVCAGGGSALTVTLTLLEMSGALPLTSSV